MRVEVKNKIDPLTIEKWEFDYNVFYNTISIVLYFYGVKESEKKRKYEPLRQYLKYEKRATKAIGRHEVPLPENIKKQVEEQILAKLKESLKWER